MSAKKCTKQDHQFFCFKCTPGPKASSFQFASLVMFHLQCACGGLFCDLFKDWDGKHLFWVTEWMDWSQENENRINSSLQFFARRWLRQQDIPESELSDYLKLELKF